MNGHRVFIALAAAAVVMAMTGPAAHADATLASYRVVAQGAGFNWTYDSPTSNFHPQADNELPYAEIDGDPTRAHAISSLYWPGAAGGNLGSLIAVLGGPAVNGLNDPVRAEASSVSTNQQATAAPTGTTMTASVVPEGDASQEASAAASWAGADLGQGTSIGAVTAAAKHTLGKDGKLVATARNSVADVDIGGMFHAGLITTSATEQSVGGAKPTGTSTITVHDLTIGGQKAYVDGSGVHMGEPGKPAGSPVVDGVSKGMAGAGMSIYFTTPAKVNIGGVDYDYAPALLIYWAPPGDSNHDVFTLGFGGASIGMVVSGGETATSGGGGTDVGTGVDTGGVGTGALPVSGSGTAAGVPTSPASTTLQLPSPASHAAKNVPRVLGNRLVSARSHGGIGGWWFLLLALAAVLGAILFSRVPALLTTSAAASTCAHERTTTNRRS